jgi:hypothetical protein
MLFVKPEAFHFHHLLISFAPFPQEVVKWLLESRSLKCLTHGMHKTDERLRVCHFLQLSNAHIYIPYQDYLALLNGCLIQGLIGYQDHLVEVVSRNMEISQADALKHVLGLVQMLKGLQFTEN